MKRQIERGTDVCACGRVRSIHTATEVFHLAGACECVPCEWRRNGDGPMVGHDRDEAEGRQKQAKGAQAPAPQRRRLPTTRKGVTRKFEIHGGDAGEPRIFDVYVTVGLYDDGAPGEVFVKVGKAGSELSGVYAALSLVISMALQHGVPLRALLDKLRWMRFEPSGPTGDPEIGLVASIPDAIAKWMLARFCGGEDGPT